MTLHDDPTTFSAIRTRRLILTDASGHDSVALDVGAAGELLVTRGNSVAIIRLGADETSITLCDPIGKPRVGLVSRLDGGRVVFHSADGYATRALTTRDGELAVEDDFGQRHEFITGG